MTKIGQRNGMLEVIEELGSELIHGVHHKMIMVKCDCGVTKKIRLSNFRANTRSCGCMRGNKKYHSSFADNELIRLNFERDEARRKERDDEMSRILSSIEELDELIHHPSTTLAEAMKLRCQQKVNQEVLFSKIDYKQVMCKFL